MSSTQSDVINTLSGVNDTLSDIFFAVSGRVSVDRFIKIAHTAINWVVTMTATNSEFSNSPR